MAASRRAGLWRPVLTAVLLFTPAPVAVVLRVGSPDPPERIPIHWGLSSPADGFGNSDVFWWLRFAAGVAAGVGVLVLGGDVLVRGQAIVLGVVAAVGMAAAMMWPASVLSEAAAGGLTGDRGDTFLLLLLGLVWGVVVFFASGPVTGAGSSFNLEPSDRPTGPTA